MNLDGSAVLHADRERVWSALTDPAVLARTIPGCRSLEQVGEDSYRLDVAAGVGAIKGTYAGEVHLTDQQRPARYVMHASGAGAPGQVRATVTVDLADQPDGQDGATVLTWSADAVVGGPVAGVGQRMITGVAKRMAGQFFSAVDAELTGAAAPAPAAPAAPVGAAPAEAAPAVPAAAAPAAAGRVFAGTAAAPAPADARALALGAAGGALLTLIGVAVGWLLGRRR
ncbi:carbon monoxide dehydrogenase subunit G [Geodermatophilus sp. YIM 151500]|uniref:SRPBCC family protein n=1 Tax=Geodermatophilus sp. YIM 151500 TaxID=2984531 RepID=UPI0021E39512|nr:carbon monoxide dehydrogenase subunit G [Geodermatophilus sp. YIM 151500]MCV2491155.1 carbon monoxide dehydrogenase subunit G [Geodermatophilus sp. YIM 151500]